MAQQKTSGITFASNPVIAHRGAFKQNHFPENSIAALRHAIQLKCAGSEFDVRMTADDSLIVNHDPHYHQMNIETTSFDKLSVKPLGNREPLPTLRQYLQAGLQENSSTRLVLEIKPSTVSKERGRRIAEKCVQMVQQMKASPMVVYISFDYDILKRIREIDATAPTQYLNGDVPPEQLKADRINGADYHYSVFRKNPQWIHTARQLGIVLNAWTVNDRADMEWLLYHHFDFITTNEPELLFEVVASQKKQ